MSTEQLISVISQQEFPELGMNTRSVETSNSLIIRSDRYVFKIRKPEQYSGMDLSDVEKRKEICLKELDLNRSLAGWIYEGVVPVLTTLQDKKDETEIVDYALKMKCLGESKKLLYFLENNKVDEEMLNNIVRVITDFHEKTTIIKDTFNLTRFRRKFEEINRCGVFMNDIFGEDYFSRIRESIHISAAFLSTHRYYFQERAITGYVRDGHGNLCAETIFINEHPVIIERAVTNEEQRKMDVLFDIARLGVDLDVYGLHTLDAIFLTNYLEKMGHSESKKIRDLYTYYKLFRVNLLITRIVDEVTIYDLSETVKDHLIRYFELLMRYTEELASNV